MIKYFLIGRYLNSDTWPAVIPRLLQLELISPSPEHHSDVFFCVVAKLLCLSLPRIHSHLGKE